MAKEIKHPQEVIQTAMKVLEECGYATRNLWHIDDVTQSHPHLNLTKDECLEVLDHTLSNEQLTEETYRVMDDSVAWMFNPEKDDEGLDIPVDMYPDEILRMKMEGASKKDIQKKQQDNE